MDFLKKKIVVGLDKRADWECKLGSLLNGLTDQIGLELEQDEQAHLAALPPAIANLIYAGMLDSVVLEFGGEVCEVAVEYYPEEDEQDDLDLSVLEVVDWDVDTLRIKVMVVDHAYASAVSGLGLRRFSSEQLNVEVEEVSGDDADDVCEDESELSEDKVNEENNIHEREEVQ